MGGDVNLKNLLINKNYIQENKELNLYDIKNKNILVFLIRSYRDLCNDCKQVHDFEQTIPIYITNIYQETHEKKNIYFCKGHNTFEKKIYNFKAENIDDPNDDDEVPEWNHEDNS